MSVESQQVMWALRVGAFRKAMWCKLCAQLRDGRAPYPEHVYEGPLEGAPIANGNIICWFNWRCTRCGSLVSNNIIPEPD